MDNKTFNQLKKYSDANGVVTALDDNITMKLNAYGLYEESIIDETKTINDKALQVMSHLNTHTNETKIGETLFSHIKQIKFNEQLGYYQNLYAGYVLEDNYREIATAGGIATWLFSELFKRDLIDGVIHVKQNKDKDSHLLFKYDISYSVDEIKKGAKSKYYPVEMSEVLKVVKDKPGRYALIGGPSFIMSCRLLAETKPIFKERIKFMIGLITGHQKSSRFAESLAWQAGIAPGQLSYIDFRKPIIGKPASDYAVELKGYVDHQLKTIIKPMKSFIDQDWGEGYFKTLASDFLDDVFNETADVTLGDAWLDNYNDDIDGTNVVITRNEIIDQILKEGHKQQQLKLDVLTEQEVMDTQTSHYRHTHDELKYRLYKLKIKNQWYPKKRVEAINDLSEFRQKVQDLRALIRKESHIYYLKALKEKDLNIYLNKMQSLQKMYKKLYKEKNNM
ncbi:Coenzyme F420 hydrogenase/dehydrogenase, beta subunit C-terminal domain [Mycoplasmatota bacterium]|nr:Coenzyme F420 hydrogenase/dehydrogenase, beta subunit C-terminal domain [Mycoplasmatota bacterium]